MKNNLVSKALKNNFVQDYERRMSFQKIRLFDHAIQFDIPLLLNIDLGLQLYRFKEGIVTHWVEQDMFSKFHSKAYDFFANKKVKSKINKLLRYIEESLIKLHKFSIDIPDYSKVSDEFLRIEYKNFCKIERETSFMNQLLFLYFEKAITQVLKHYLGEDATQKLKDLSLQTETIPLDVYYLDICSHLFNEINLEELYKKYAHFGMVDVTDQPLSKEKLSRDIERIKQKNPVLVKIEIEKKYLENGLKVNNVFSKINPEEHIYTLIKYFQIYSNKKEWKNFIREMSSYKLSKLLSEIAERRSVTLQELSYLREEEICKIITRDMNFENIKCRKENSLYIIHRNQINVIEDKKLLNKIDLNLSNNILSTLKVGISNKKNVVQKSLNLQPKSSISKTPCFCIDHSISFFANKEVELKGEIACSGKIFGKVCIILSNQDFHKFNEGDIIVAPTTRPDYVPLMEKSSAIITNEGGMLSHTAILSREFGKPCIIGTRIATTVLKDGDFIEVDAYKGTLKLIN